MPELDAMSKNSRIIRMPSIKDNLGLSKKEFESFKLNVSKGDESIFLQLFSVQLPSSIQYLRNKFSISAESAHDVCMETMLDFRDKLVQNKIAYGNLRYLFTRMAVNKYIDSQKRSNRVNEAIQVFQSSIEISNNDSEHFFATLDFALENLKPDQRKFIEDIYQSGKDMAEFAEDNGMTYSNLRKRKQRVLDKLKTNFFAKLKS